MIEVKITMKVKGGGGIDDLGCVAVLLLTSGGIIGVIGRNVDRHLAEGVDPTATCIVCLELKLHIVFVS
jgi:hypothetical protein